MGGREPQGAVSPKIWTFRIWENGKIPISSSSVFMASNNALGLLCRELSSLTSTPKMLKSLGVCSATWSTLAIFSTSNEFWPGFRDTVGTYASNAITALSGTGQIEWWEFYCCRSASSLFRSRVIRVKSERCSIKFWTAIASDVCCSSIRISRFPLRMT